MRTHSDMTNLFVHTAARHARRAFARVLLPAGVLAVAACNLDVSTPDVVQPGAAEGADALPTRLAGTVGDFAVAYSGYANGNNGDGLALISGLMADEFIATDYFDTHAQIDTRSLVPSNGTNSGVERNIMRAMVSAQATADAFAAAGLEDDPGRARALNLVGFGYVLVAENYCSGVPFFSTLDASGKLVGGASQSTAEMLTNAGAKFDEAMAVAEAAGDDQQAYVAQIGKGRALLDAGQYTQAAAAVANVPIGFSFYIEHGNVDNRERNGIHELTYVSTRYTTANGEGGNGLHYVDADDPRVPTEYIGDSFFDQGTPLYAPVEFSSYSSPTPLATGVEAALIRAEAAFQNNNYAGANGTLEILNSLRSAAGMSLLTPAANASAQVDQLFRERAFWLFATAHRLGDLRRLMKVYGRAEDAVFPTGAYFKGGFYGNQVSLMVPQEEGRNPNYDASACDPTQP
jgi:hypothetical protein